MTRTSAAPIAGAALGVGAVAAVLVGGHSPIRAILVVAFVVFAPGYAVAHLLRLPDVLLTICVSVGTSVSLCVLVSVGALYAGVWSPVAILVALALIAIAGAVADVILVAGTRRR